MTDPTIDSLRAIVVMLDNIHHQLALMNRLLTQQLELEHMHDERMRLWFEMLQRAYWYGNAGKWN